MNERVTITIMKNKKQERISWSWML